MAKKNTEPTAEAPIELTEAAAEVQPAAPAVQSAPVMPGYIRIRLADGTGKVAGIIVHATQYGEDKPYKPDTWTVIEELKKK